MGRYLIKGGAVLTADQDDRVLDADILVRAGRIERILSRPHYAPIPDAEVIDAAECAVLPGFIQTHVHLCQTLMRGYADDLSLIQWLRGRVWPMEASHTPESLFASAQLGIAELIRGGTTTALTMETVRHTDAVFHAVEQSGFRAIVGKCMMDRGDGVPPPLAEETSASIGESVALLREWHGRAGGRLRYAFAPRFALSCSQSLLEKVAHLAREHGVIVHTHASESREEVEIVRAETGLDNITYLHKVGLSGPTTVLAHCVWATDPEITLLAETGTRVAHCPSSNLKLGSGIARVAEMIEAGVPVSIGADGAPCNNRLDMLTEIRTAALLQKARHGPDSLPARTAFRLATIDGARALGLESEIGSIEEGKRADLSIIALTGLHATPHPDVVSALIFAAESADVRTVMIDGRLVVKDGVLLTLDEGSVRSAALRESEALAIRAGLTGV